VRPDQSRSRTKKGAPRAALPSRAADPSLANADSEVEARSIVVRRVVIRITVVRIAVVVISRIVVGPIIVVARIVAVIAVVPDRLHGSVVAACRGLLRPARQIHRGAGDRRAGDAEAGGRDCGGAGETKKFHRDLL